MTESAWQFAFRDAYERALAAEAENERLRGALTNLVKWAERVPAETVSDAIWTWRETGKWHIANARVALNPTREEGNPA